MIVRLLRCRCFGALPAMTTCCMVSGILMRIRQHTDADSALCMMQGFREEAFAYVYVFKESSCKDVQRSFVQNLMSPETSTAFARQSGPSLSKVLVVALSRVAWLKYASMSVYMANGWF